MKYPFFLVDAFAHRPFSGNPAAVVLLDGPIPDALMQSAAAEINQAETAFLFKEADHYRLRWFSPTVEVALCGHATLASASVLFQEAMVEVDTIYFETLGGRLSAKQIGRAIQLDFPALDSWSVEDGTLAWVPGVLSEVPIWTGRNIFDAVVELPSEEAVRSLKVDFGALASQDFRGLIVTARSETPTIDFISRFFCPSVGILEDPATGSAHCCLAKYWSGKLGKARMHALQASKRGAEITVELAGDRVLLEGFYHRVVKGEIDLSG